MIIAEPFVFVHVPKTGGTWVRELLREHAPPAWQVRAIADRHVPYRELTAAERCRPCFWCVRNPWDWHVSDWHFWTGHYQARTGGYALPEAQWSELERWWGRIAAQGLDFAETLPLVIAGKQTEAAYLDRLCCDEQGERRGYAVRFEGLRQNLSAYLRGLGLQLPSPMVRALREAPARQVSQHREFWRYYTPELVELVAQAEAPLLAPPFNYRWETP